MMEKLKRSKEDAKGEKEKDGGLDADSYHEYIPDRTAVAALRDLLAEWHLKAPCVSRFTQPLGKNYKVDY